MMASFSVNDVPPIAAAARTNMFGLWLEPAKKTFLPVHICCLDCFTFRADHRHLCSLWHRLRLLRTPDRLGERERLQSGLCQCDPRKHRGSEHAECDFGIRFHKIPTSLEFSFPVLSRSKTLICRHTLSRCGRSGPESVSPIRRYPTCRRSRDRRVWSPVRTN